jgi:hypothetical protein
MAAKRTHWKIPCYRPDNMPSDTAPVTVAEAARELGVVPSTVPRWIADGFIPAEQTTPARPGASGSPTNCVPLRRAHP